jgi:hypothetical protein
MVEPPIEPEDDPEEIPINPHPAPDEEALFFDHLEPEDQTRRKLRLENDRIDQDNKLSKEYSTRAFYFAITWLIFLIVFIAAQSVLVAIGMGMSDKSFIAVVISLTAAVFGFWYLVGRYLFPHSGK